MNMAQRRRRTGFGNSYEKRRVDGQWTPPTEGEAAGLTSSDARALGAQIDEQNTRWRTNGVRLVRGRTCCVVVRHSQTGEERELQSAEQWSELAALEADQGVA
jgi:hypothetical protein